MLTNEVLIASQAAGIQRRHETPQPIHARGISKRFNWARRLCILGLPPCVVWTFTGYVTPCLGQCRPLVDSVPLQPDRLDANQAWFHQTDKTLGGRGQGSPLFDWNSSFFTNFVRGEFTDSVSTFQHPYLQSLAREIIAMKFTFISIMLHVLFPIALLMLISPVATAVPIQTLPTNDLFGSYYLGGNTTTVAGTGNFQHTSPDGGSAFISLSSQELRGSIEVPAGDSIGAHGRATSRYYFAIIGPEANNIPLDIYYSMSYYAGGDGSYAALNLDYPAAGATSPSDFINKHAELSAFNGAYAAPSKLGVLSTTIPANYVEAIQLSLELNAVAYFPQPPNCCEGGGLAGATIDPYLHIDPRFPNADLYRIKFSSGVTNGAPLPVSEPASPYMFVIGIGLIGLAIRSKQIS